MKVYLAGPMRNVPLWNFPAFDAAQALLEEAGHQVFNPAQHDRDEGLNEHDYPELPDWFTLEKALQWDFAKIIEAGNICLLDGWEASSGAAKELRVAEDIGAKVWRCQGDTLVEWNYDLVHKLQGRGGTDRLLANGTEHRVVDPVTGGAKGQKSARTDLLPPDALLELAEHYGRGTVKYESRNWERGYAWSLSHASLLRHLLAWWGGAELDEDGFPHITAVAWHAIALLTFSLRKDGTDDRPVH